VGLKGFVLSFFLKDSKIKGQDRKEWEKQGGLRQQGKRWDMGGGSELAVKRKGGRKGSMMSNKFSKSAYQGIQLVSYTKLRWTQKWERGRKEH